MTALDASIYFFIYAFLGWCLEVGFNRLKRKTWVNRGFLNGPLCPIYGVGVLLIIWIVEVSSNLLGINMISGLQMAGLALHALILNAFTLFLLITLITTLLELVTGAVLEMLFMTKWWDYSDNLFNFKGYICLRFSLAWGCAGCLVLFVLHPLIVWCVSLLNAFQSQLILSALLSLFTIDMLATIKALIDFRKLLLELERVSEEYNNAKVKLLAELEHILNELENPAHKIKAEIGRINKGVNASKEKIKAQLGALKDSELLPNGVMKEFLKKRVDFERFLKKPLQTNINEIYGRFNKLTSKLSRNRFIRSFPDMQSDKFGNQLNAIRSKYNEARGKLRKK